MRLKRNLVVTLAAATAIASAAAAQAPKPPPSVARKIQVMDTACGVAGGRPGGGAYVLVYDFSGDGVNDYLLSEGNYSCLGRPDLFRKDGKAVVEVYVANGLDAPRAFYEVVRGYRILDGRPRTIQIVREGPGCGDRPTCGVTLLWDAATRRLVGGAAASATRPAQTAAPAAAVGVLSAAEVRSQIVGRQVSSEEGMNWYYYPDGKYDADDGRIARGGTYVVRPDGRLCWNDRVGSVSGCFQYYRKGGQLHLRRADPDNTFELGRITISPIPR